MLLAGVNAVTGVPLSNPGSVSKKYSIAVIFGWANAPKHEQANNKMANCFMLED